MISSVVTKLTKKGTRMATFTLEDTTGHVEAVCFKYEDFANAIAEDTIVKVKGKYEVGDRNQLMAFEVERLDLADEPTDVAPRTVALSVMQRDLSQSNMQFLTQILRKYPGQDSLVLFVSQHDGRKYRANLPLTVDSHDKALFGELQSLFGRKVWSAAS